MTIAIKEEPPAANALLTLEEERDSVVPGLDTAREDPTGRWSLEAENFEEVGRQIGSLRLPTLVVQEGGYDTRVLGINARRFFSGLWAGYYSA